MAIPIAPTIAGIGAVLLVRVILWSKKQSISWNLCVIGLAIMATFVSLEGSEISTFYGFWMGITYGGMGQGIINMGRSTLTSAIQDRFSKAVAAFLGTKPPEPNELDPK